MRIIYLSPHLDDAALSAGGWLYQKARAGVQVEVWTLLAGLPRGALSPFAQRLHTQWGIPDPANLVRARRAEDTRAAKILGVTPLHFDLLDCIYRQDAKGNWLYDDIFVPIHAAESNLPTRIADFLTPRLTPDDQVFCQLGIGAHIDHTLIRRAAELLRRPLRYIADLPYLFRAPNTLPAYLSNMAKKTSPLDADSVKAWQSAVSAYASQISSLFESEEDMRASIEQYAAGGLSIWRKK